MPQLQFQFALRRFLQTCFCVASLIVATSSWATQTETVLHGFNVVPNGDAPYARLVADAYGNFYGATYSGGTYRSGTAFRLSPQATGGFALTVIYNFGTDNSGFNPGPLTIDSTGNLYGTLSTTTGGSVFKLTPSSNGTWKAVSIATFASNAGPSGQLTFDHSGNLYGVSAGGGVSKWGAVYELAPTLQGPWLETTLYSFTNGTDGGVPNGGVVFDASGNLYGTTSSGGDPGCNGWNQRNPTCGVVFKLTNNGGVWSETTLLTFNFNNGAFPQGGPVFDSAGNLYGSTFQGPGINCDQGCGTIYRLSPNSDGTWTQSLIYTFPGGPSGAYPNGNLVFDSHGNIYGSTSGGGSASCGYYGCGTIFELSPTSGAYWAEKVLYQFARGNSVGIKPSDGVTFDSAGNLYGSVSTSDGYYCCLGTIFELSPGSGGKWNFSSVYSYSTGSDGLYPTTSLVSDGAGNLYGITDEGGNYKCGNVGCGAVFKLSPLAGGGWSESVIYDFTEGFIGGNYGPTANIVVDAAGNLYGTAQYGGDRTCWCGFVFELSPSASGTWQQTILHNFIGGNDGSNPQTGLTFGPDGRLYGATVGGGSFNYGTVFELTPNSNGTWGESVVYSFNSANGSGPASPVMFDAVGNIYGTTVLGGVTSQACSYGCGVIFELSPNGFGGWTESVLYNFQGRSDGSRPSGLVRDAAGNLYGTTEQGGNSSKFCYLYGNSSTCGTVFELSKSGSLWSKSTLYKFYPETIPDDGALPMGGLALDSVGNLYGTTSAGGDLTCVLFTNYLQGCGTVFKLSPGTRGLWTETILHVFEDYDGAAPVAAPFLDPSGNLFSTTIYGGDAGYGTVVEIAGATSATTTPAIRDRTAVPRRTHPLAERPLSKRGAVPLLDQTVAASAGKEIR